MRQNDADHRRILNALLDQVRGHDEGPAKRSGVSPIKRSSPSVYSRPSTLRLVATIGSLAIRQNDADHRRILNALLDQVRGHDEGRYNDICMRFQQDPNYYRNYLNWLLDTLYQKNWDSDYSVQQRTDHLRESILELNKRIICLEEQEAECQGHPAHNPHQYKYRFPHIVSEREATRSYNPRYRFLMD